MSVVQIVVVVPPTPNVNGTAQQPLHSTVNLLTPVSLLKMNVDKPTLVKPLLHQNSKQKQTMLSFSVMLSMPRVHTSDTRSKKHQVLEFNLQLLQPIQILLLQNFLQKQMQVVIVPQMYHRMSQISPA